MMYYQTLPEQLRSLLLILMFAAALCEFVLILLHIVSYSGKLWRNLPAILIFAVLFSFIVICHSDSPFRHGIPVALIIALLIIAAVHIPIKVIHSLNHRRNNLSPYAVKEAIDDLTTGVCFADNSGRIVLCNHTMGELSAALIGSYPQTANEIVTALDNPSVQSGVTRISDEPVLHRFPDGGVWRFCTVELSEPHGFVQTTAQNVTKLHEANERLRSENEEMRKVNASLKKMYERLSDCIREQETLDLKMRIHNNIGTSLIAISEIMNNDNDGDMEKQLAILKDAVSYFSDDRPAVKGTFDEVRQQAAKMKVSVVLKGSIPSDATTEGLIVSATRECVTNCVYHARGNKVNVEITEHFNIYTVTITNNGEPPKHKIAEGGGLSNLRKSIESAGGEMHISHSPAFALILNLPRKEPEL